MKEEIGPKSCRALSLQHLPMLQVQVFYVVVEPEVAAPQEIQGVSAAYLTWPANAWIQDRKWC